MAHEDDFYLKAITRSIFGNNSTASGVCTNVPRTEAHRLWGEDPAKRSNWNESNCPVDIAIEKCVASAEDICRISFNNTNEKFPEEQPVSDTNVIIVMSFVS